MIPESSLLPRKLNGPIEVVALIQHIQQTEEDQA
jgi:hypothetical protein